MLTLLLAAVLTLPSPAGPASSAPHLATLQSGAVAMSWTEGNAVKFATLANGKWSAARVIAQRGDFFVNWADFPSIVEDAKGTLFAHWLQKSGSATYAYDVWITSSSDGGKTWRTPRVLHRDGKQAEHGFVSMVPLANSGVGAVWLDGREMGDEAHPKGAMTLRYTEIDASLKTRGETVLDGRVCECCTTAMTMTSAGPLVAFRDRSDDEIRDIGITRRVKGIWTRPVRVSADNWKIAGCPVNGPQLASRGNDAVIAWFTATGNQPRVQAAFSRDGGATFGKAVRIDAGGAVGRVDALLLADGSALVTWIEGAGENAGIFVRRVHRDGRAEAPVKLAATTAARAAGFPRATLSGNTAYFAFTDPETKTIRVLMLKN